MQQYSACPGSVYTHLRDYNEIRYPPNLAL
jgi:hypothetical protein